MPVNDCASDFWVKRRMSMPQQDSKGTGRGVRGIEATLSRARQNKSTVAKECEVALMQEGAMYLTARLKDSSVDCVMQMKRDMTMKKNKERRPKDQGGDEQREKNQSMFEEKQMGTHPKSPIHLPNPSCIRLGDTEGIMGWDRACSVESGGRSHRVGVPFGWTRIKQSGWSKWSERLASGGGGGVSQRTSEPMSVMAAALRTQCRGREAREGPAHSAALVGESG
ncbi:hypothetical protein B0H13DRAFT_1862224 [Mycena leptocephala]|nr:hypothetical protein B0H13DRAFT_1862224 [Mycena leptocephala]